MNESLLIQQLLQTWQSLAIHGTWQQDAFLLCVSLIIVVMLFLSGTMIGLFVQSLWGIFITSGHPAEAE